MSDGGVVVLARDLAKGAGSKIYALDAEFSEDRGEGGERRGEQRPEGPGREKGFHGRLPESAGGLTRAAEGTPTVPNPESLALGSPPDQRRLCPLPPPRATGPRRIFDLGFGLRRYIKRNRRLLGYRLMRKRGMRRLGRGFDWQRRL